MKKLAWLALLTFGLCATTARAQDDPFEELMKNLQPLQKLLENPDPTDAELDQIMQGLQQQLMKQMMQLQQQLQVPGGGAGGFAFPNFPLQPLGGLGQEPAGNAGVAGTINRLGVSVGAVSPELADQLGIVAKDALLIKEVKSDSPADKAGLRVNDVLLEIDDKTVGGTPGMLRERLKEVKPDTEVEALVYRKGKKERLKELKLPEAAADQPDANPARGRGPRGAVRPLFQRQEQVAPGIPLRENLNVNRESFQLQVTNGQYTVTQMVNDITVTLKGTKGDGKFKPSSISVNDGAKGNTVTVDKLDDVPKEYRAAVDTTIKRLE